MAKRKLEPDKIIDYSVDYYALLGLEHGCLSSGGTHEDRASNASQLDTAYRTRARYCHPDFGGTADSFKLLVRAHTILSDPILRKIYESGGSHQVRQVEDGDTTGFDVNWEGLGSFREGTTADITGSTMFLSVCNRKSELNLVPSFFPKTSIDSYEWDLTLPDMEEKVVFSIVHDEDDVLRLTGGEIAEDSMPFKIYVCIPRSQIQFLRGEDEEVVYDDGSVDEVKIKGKLNRAVYSDYNLFETTRLSEATAYIAPGGKFERDLAAFRNGTLKAKQEIIDRDELEIKWVPKEQIQQSDADLYRRVLLEKVWKTQRREDADNWLQRIPDRSK